MPSATYQDLIDNKVAHWQAVIATIEERLSKPGSGDREALSQSLQQLKDSVAAATSELHELNNRETAETTLAVKDQILKIFDSIDRDLSAFVERSPFML